MQVNRKKKRREMAWCMCSWRNKDSYNAPFSLQLGSRRSWLSSDCSIYFLHLILLRICMNKRENYICLYQVVHSFNRSVVVFFLMDSRRRRSCHQFYRQGTPIFYQRLFLRSLQRPWNSPQRDISTFFATIYRYLPFIFLLYSLYPSTSEK